MLLFELLLESVKRHGMHVTGARLKHRKGFGCVWRGHVDEAVFRGIVFFFRFLFFDLRRVCHFWNRLIAMFRWYYVFTLWQSMFSNKFKVALLLPALHLTNIDKKSRDIYTIYCFVAVASFDPGYCSLLQIATYER